MLLKGIMIKILATGIPFTILAWLAFSYNEATSEIRVLCSTIKAGQKSASAMDMLETGEYINYQSENQNDSDILFISSPYNLQSNSCTLALKEGKVISSQYTE